MIPLAMLAVLALAVWLWREAPDDFAAARVTIGAVVIEAALIVVWVVRALL